MSRPECALRCRQELGATGKWHVRVANFNILLTQSGELSLWDR